MSGEYHYSFKYKDRKKLNAVSQRIFDRLVSIDDNFVNLINTAENALTGVIMIGGLILLFTLNVILVGWAVGRFEVLTELVSALQSESTRLIVSGVLTLPVFFFAVWRPLQMLSDTILEYVGRWIIMTRKFGNNRNKKNAVLDAVSNWMRTRPEQASRIYEQLYKKAPRDLFPLQFRQKLEDLTNGKSDPYMIVERFVEIKPWTEYSKHWFLSPRDEERQIYFLRSRALRNAIKVSLAYHLMNTELRDEVPAGDRWVREYKTDRNRQITALFDEVDLHHRFRSSAPHYRWPDLAKPKSVGETATIRAIACIENPSNMPFYVLPVKLIMNEFPGVIRDFYEDAQGDDEAALEARQERYEAVIRKLAEINVKMFGKYSRKTLLTTSETGIEPQPILRDLSLSKGGNNDIEELLLDEEHEHDWALRWDPNFIDWSEIQNDAESDTSQSFAVLYEAIERASRQAKPVTLKRGDCLFIDNLRCLVARKEVTPLTRGQAVAALPQEWWLRGYYGFRMSEQTSFSRSVDTNTYTDEYGISWPAEAAPAQSSISTPAPTQPLSTEEAPLISPIHTVAQTASPQETMKRDARLAERKPGTMAPYLRDET